MAMRVPVCRLYARIAAGFSERIYSRIAGYSYISVVNVMR